MKKCNWESVLRLDVCISTLFHKVVNIEKYTLKFKCNLKLY